MYLIPAWFFALLPMCVVFLLVPIVWREHVMKGFGSMEERMKRVVLSGASMAMLSSVLMVILLAVVFGFDTQSNFGRGQ